MAKYFIKPPFSKLDRVLKSDDGYITNGHWAVRLEFIESYPNNIELTNGPLHEKIFPSGEGTPIYPTIHLVESLTHGEIYRKFASEDESSKIWVNEDYYRMFRRSGLELCWTFYCENRPLVANTVKDDRFVGILGPVTLGEKYRNLGVDC